MVRYQARIAIAGPTKTNGRRRVRKASGSLSTRPLNTQNRRATPPTPHTIATNAMMPRGRIAVAQEDEAHIEDIESNEGNADGQQNPTDQGKDPDPDRLALRVSRRREASMARSSDAGQPGCG